MTKEKMYPLSDYPVLKRMSERTSRDTELDIEAVLLFYEMVATDDDRADMDEHERGFADAVLASRYRQSPPPSVPFKAICPHCSDVIISWHASCTDVPRGETRGIAYCGCGRTAADSSDMDGMGRIIEVRQKD